MTPFYSCIHDLIATQAQADPDAIAIDSPERPPLTYHHLWTQTRDVMMSLSAMGLGRQDRVALVLPNGPELAVAFLAVAACATCVPLNPAYQANEFDDVFTALEVKALILASGMDSPARDVVHKHRIPVIDLTPTEAGGFTLSHHTALGPPRHGVAESQDVALVLQTSGTTSQPKIVPLTHDNLCTAAQNICRTLSLSRADRCLNMMSLYHIHGLVTAILSSLAVGGSVVCTSGFDPQHFFTWLSAYHPTWYSAVPTMHQAILEQASAYPGGMTRTSLRLIRSSSAPLPPRVMAELERVFNVPVIEAYGMTEASHQIASNPLPPYERKAGSVGVAAGPQIAIMDEVGTIVPQGVTGEVVIRGATVMPGYDNVYPTDPDAFTQGWFRTGDQGFLDNDHYLFLTSRLKEMINRGGQNVSPREVDDALMHHPAIAQVVTFAVPHATLGEDVAAAVVLRRGTRATEADIRAFALERLTAYKVPSQVVLVDAIPTGPTGKVQRLGLAETLASQLYTAFVPPRNDVETGMARIWGEVLGLERVGVQDNFFALGGDSLLAMDLLTRIKKRCGKTLAPIALLRAPTVSQLASLLDQQDDPTSWRSLVPIQPHGAHPPFFCMHGPRGGVLNQRQLAFHLGLDQPYYGLQAQGLDDRQSPHLRIEDMATHYITELRTVQTEGPYFLGGFCFGGLIAFEVAQQLLAQDHQVALLVLVETPLPRHSNGMTRQPSYRHKITRLAGVGRYHTYRMSRLTPREQLSYMRKWGRRLTDKLRSNLYIFIETCVRRLGRLLPPLPPLRDLALIHHQARKRYIPKPYAGRITLFLSAESPEASRYDSRLAWDELAAEGAEVYELAGNRNAMHVEPYVQGVAQQLRQCLFKAQLATSRTAMHGDDNPTNRFGISTQG